MSNHIFQCGICGCLAPSVEHPTPHELDMGDGTVLAFFACEATCEPLLQAIADRKPRLFGPVLLGYLSNAVKDPGIGDVVEAVIGATEAKLGELADDASPEDAARLMRARFRLVPKA